MSKHTPGPWVFTFFCKPGGELIKTAQDVADAVAASAMKSDVGELWGVSLPGESEDSSVVVCYTGNGPTSEANARLIAVAPELLAACDASLKALRSYQFGNSSPDLAEEIANHIEVVISKATPRDA